MNAASSYVFAYNLSESEESEEEEVVVLHDKKINQKKRRRVLDTNVLKIDFNCLQEVKFVTSFKPIKCSQCPAILTSNETLLNNLDGTGRKWQCSYCESGNSLSGEQDSMQLADDTTYVSEKAEEISKDSDMKKEIFEVDKEDDSIINFCIDVSGSMGQTVMTRKEKNKTVYISRLDATKAAILNQLEELSNNKPNVKVGITTFGSTLEYKGDGISALDEICDNSVLNDKEQLLKIGTSISPPEAIKSTLPNLTSIVKKCEPLNMTALGPALLLCTSATVKCRGSKVILCTDGMANVGLGRLENYTSEVDIRKAEEFYGFVSTYANEIGTSISILAISGGECRLAELGSVAANTNGQVNIVDPNDLGEEFKGILQDSIVGTNVRATVVLPKGFYIRDYMALDNKSIFHKTFEIGTATASTEFTLEYGLNTTNIEKDSVRFQLIIEYKNKKGSSIIRVIEKQMKITRDRKKAEEKIDMNVWTVNAMQQGGRLHERGNVHLAASKMRAAKSYLDHRPMSSSSSKNFAAQAVGDYIDALDDECNDHSSAPLKAKRSDQKSKNLFSNLKFKSKNLKK